MGEGFEAPKLRPNSGEMLNRGTKIEQAEINYRKAYEREMIFIEILARMKRDAI